MYGILMEKLHSSSIIKTRLGMTVGKRAIFYFRHDFVEMFDRSLMSFGSDDYDDLVMETDAWSPINGAAIEGIEIKYEEAMRDDSNC